MPGILLVMIVMIIWLVVKHHQPRTLKKASLRNDRACMAELAHEEPFWKCSREAFEPPSMKERIDSCHETLAQVQANIREHQPLSRLHDDPVNTFTLVALLYTTDKMHRALIFHYPQRRLYKVAYENLHLDDVDELYLTYAPGRPCGWWEADGGESWYDDLDSARTAACDVLKLLE